MNCSVAPYDDTPGVCGHGDPNCRKREKNPHLRGKGYTQRCRDAMGIDWMNRDELAEAIPPAYTEFLGKQALAQLRVAAACRGA